MNTHVTVVPAHVPSELVVPYDQLNGPEVMSFPPTAVRKAAQGRPVFYSSLYGGFWVITRYEDARTAYQDPQLFRQWSHGVPANPFTKQFKPLYLNPPDHGKWRKVLTPLFSPRQMARQEDFLRTLAREQLAKMAPKGQTEFVEDFADVLPGRMFCFLLGLPRSRYAEFAQMAHDLIFGPASILRDGGTPEDAKAFRGKVNRQIDQLVESLIPERRKNPGDDIISILLEGEVDGEKLSDEDIINMSTLLFFAGTDSSRAAMAYAFKYLSEHPAQRDEVVRRRGDPDFIKQASEELLRFHGFHMSARECTRDAVFAGVQMKAGDIVLISTGATNRDPEKFPRPDEVDLDRSNAASHLTFGAGPHRCIGSHLATLQLRIALDEVHKVITDYRPDPVHAVRFVGGQGKVIPENLNLIFTACGASAA